MRHPKLSAGTALRKSFQTASIDGVLTAFLFQNDLAVSAALALSPAAAAAVSAAAAVVSREASPLLLPGAAAGAAAAYRVGGASPPPFRLPDTGGALLAQAAMEAPDGSPPVAAIE